jgi:hypothetical protein
VHDAAQVGELERVEDASGVDGDVVDRYLVDDCPDVLMLHPVEDEHN